MIKRVLIVSLAGLSLVGCANTDSLSGDVYTASEAKQVQNVTYGTIVNVRPVKIQAGDNDNVIGAIGGAVLGGFWVTLWVVVRVVLWQRRRVLSPVVSPDKACRVR